jgi:hypothetical protein
MIPSKAMGLTLTKAGIRFHKKPEDTVPAKATGDKVSVLFRKSKYC